MIRSFIYMLALSFFTLALTANIQAQDRPGDNSCIMPGDHMPMERLSCSSIFWGAAGYAMDFSLQSQLLMPDCSEGYTLRVANCYDASLNPRRYFESTNTNSRCDSEEVVARNLQCTFNRQDPRLMNCSNGTLNVFTRFSANREDLIVFRANSSTGAIQQRWELNPQSCFYVGPLH